jgi:hypothetical protein
VADATPNQNNSAPVKGVKMELKRNYVPKQLLSIVGWQKPAVLQKTAGGEMKEVEPAEWKPGEIKPPVFAGTGFPNKIWAGTVIEVPEAEAREMRQKQIAEAFI